MPYFGKGVKTKPVKSKSFNFEEESSAGYFSNLSRWLTELNLTENEYYKFLNTRDVYTNTETIAPDKAEIAPFVVNPSCAYFVYRRTACVFQQSYTTQSIFI